MDGLDADLTADEIASVGIPSQHVGPLNSIKYKNREEAATQILARATYYAPNFTKVFEYVNAIHVADVRATEKRMLADFVRPRMATGGLEILRALKAFTSTSDKHYSILQRAIKDAGPDADVATIVAALELADITT